jgi:poly(U)-specific endoribonuclease
MSPVEPTAAEIGDISMAAERLWELDHNRLQPGEDYELDLQGEKNPSDHRDVASRPLFKSVSPDLLNKPTFKAFQALLDNYVADEGVVEAVTAEEKAENQRFLNLLMDTAVMQYCHKVLVANRKAPSDRDGFIRLLETAWFGLYRRKIPNDSSGFEHVFLGEREPGKVVGLHNWLQLRSEEISGRLNYKGKIRPKRRPPAGYPVDQLITIQFEWCGEEKFMSSSLIGTSPEFEIALYTLCWASGNEETKVALGPHKIIVKAFSIQQKGGPFIGSAFPDEAPHDDEDMNRAARVIQKPFIAKRR